MTPDLEPVPQTPSRPRRALLATLAALGALPVGFAPAPALARRAALPIPLALEAPPDIDPQGYLVSEKYDGVRAVWDGQQMRFRSGLPVVLPTAFRQQLPARSLDGELWGGRGRFEWLSGTVRRLEPDLQAWSAVRYMVFDAPDVPGGFAQRWSTLSRELPSPQRPSLAVVPQHRLPDRAALERLLETVVSGGGEGLMLRAADARYEAGRSRAMLKLKPLSDAEATVVGHQAGQGQHAGRLGALRVRTDDGREFDIGTGFTHAERERPPPVGARITFSYQGRTAEGVPRFARFVRERPAGL
jgi:DNA ligase-1